jgi:hypothetical protein
MDISIFKQLELKKARRRWQWAYFLAYANAVYIACTGFFFRDHAGRLAIGFDLEEITASIIAGIILGAIAWGIHKRLSLICMSLLFLLFATSAVLSAMDEAYVKDTIGSAIAAVLLFRGILGLREMKKLIQENKAQQLATEAGSESPPLAPAS